METLEWLRTIAVLLAAFALWHQIRSSNRLRSEELRRKIIDDERDLEERAANVFNSALEASLVAINNREKFRVIKCLQEMHLQENPDIASRLEEFAGKNEHHLDVLQEISAELRNIEQAPVLSEVFRQSLRDLRRKSVGAKHELLALEVHLSKWIEAE